MRLLFYQLAYLNLHSVHGQDKTKPNEDSSTQADKIATALPSNSDQEDSINQVKVKVKSESEDLNAEGNLNSSTASNTVSDGNEVDHEKIKTV
jgi:hypothetical protein